MKRTCMIYGAGGHARVVADTLRHCDYEIVAFIDDNPAIAAIAGIPVQRYDPDNHINAAIIIGIGNNRARQKIAASITHMSAVVIHPTAAVAPDVVIGEGTVILANATVQTGASIGKHVIVNANVCIDHDAVLEDYVHIYPNSYIGGGAVISSGVTIGPGAVVVRETVVKADIEK